MRQLIVQAVLVIVCFFAAPCARPQPCLDSIRTLFTAARPDTAHFYLLNRLLQTSGCPPDSLLKYALLFRRLAEGSYLSRSVPYTYYASAYAFWGLNKNTDALRDLYTAAAIWEKGPMDELQLARCYELIASLYQRLEKFGDALTFNRRALALKRRVGIGQVMIPIYNNLGKTFRALGMKDSAIYYLDQAQAISRRLGNVLYAAQIVNNIGNVFWEAGELGAADSCYKKALTGFQRLGYAEGIAQTSFNLGTVAWRRADYPQTIAYSLESLRALPKGQPLEHQEWIYHYLSGAYAHTGDYRKAWLYDTLYNDLRDSANTLSQQKVVADMKEKYETEKKEQALVAAGERASHLALINRGNIQLIWVLAVTAILIGVMGYFLVRHSRRQQLLSQRLAEASLRENQQLISEQALKTHIAMLEGQEVERQRISRDLHDQLGSTLSSIQLLLQSRPFDWLAVRAPSGAGDPNRVFGLLDEAVVSVRRISHDLSTGILSKYGLAEALKDLKATIEASGTTVELEIGEEQQFRMPVMTEVYYIIRELVTNACRHGRSTSIFIQCLQEEKTLHVTVEDNGVGFDRSVRPAGIGLLNMEARLKKINGSYQLETAPGQGTCFFLQVPLEL